MDGLLLIILGKQNAEIICLMKLYLLFFNHFLTPQAYKYWINVILKG